MAIGHHRAMVRWLARFVVFRFLARRLIPILTVVEVAALVRGFRRRRTADPSRRASTAPGS